MRHFIASFVTTLLATSILGQSVLAADVESAQPRAATLWWVIFNNPDACRTNPGAVAQCGEIDVFGEAFLESIANGSPDPTLLAPNVDAGLAVIYATGASTTVSGRIRFVSSIYRSAGGLDLAGPNVVDPMGLGRAYENTGAEVHLVVRDHGLRVPGELSTQILNFLEPHCSDPNLLYFAGDNICADVQFAVFAPTESGTDSVYAFADPSAPVPFAKATLVRQGDMLQAIVETRITE